MSQWNNFSRGFFKENAVFVLLLGLCPTLGVTTSAFNGLGMGLATTFVLLMSNIVVSLIKRYIPDKVRIPSYIVIIASFVTIVELVMQAYIPRSLCRPWIIHPPDRCKLPRTWTCRSICFEKQPHHCSH